MPRFHPELSLLPKKPPPFYGVQASWLEANLSGFRIRKGDHIGDFLNYLHIVETKNLHYWKGEMGVPESL